MDVFRSKTDDSIRALGELPLFARCSKKDLALVANLCVQLSFEKGRVLSTSGSPGREWLVIRDGLAKATREGRTVVVLGRGDCVGEVALLDRCLHSLTVVAETAVTAYVFSPREFWSLLELSPAIGGAIAASVAHRLRDVEAANVSGAMELTHEASWTSSESGSRTSWPGIEARLERRFKSHLP